MVDIFVGSSYDGKPTGELKKYEVNDFKDFCEKYLSTCIKGEKHEYYVTIGDSYSASPGDPDASPLSYKSRTHYHRNNASQLSAWLLPFDGDNSVSRPGSCIPAEQVHRALLKLNYKHAIYTTHSHIKGEKNRWRLFIPCTLTSPEQLGPSVSYLLKLLKANGCDDLAMSTESKTWSIPWFLPTRDNPEDGHFEYYSSFEGNVFLPVEGAAKIHGDVSATEESREISEMISIIKEGISDTGLHRATRDLAYGLVRDGLAPGTAKAILHGLTSHYDLSDPRQFENKNKINALVDSAVAKVKDEIPTSPDWTEVMNADKSRIFTDYPTQGGGMEEVIKECLEWMPYPNRQIAVVAAHALISTLGGRVYTLESGSGIVLTALVTGRSTIGKSFIKKFCIWALDNFQLAHISQDFIGSHFYTSSKNLVKELEEAGSLLSVRTESGQSDKSNAGDMTRVLMYELELATESGSRGYVSSGGQNEKIPPLYSPAVTTIRESVAEIQHEADLMWATSVNGVAGRRSHVIIDPVKSSYNEKQRIKPSDGLQNLIREIYKKAANELRKKVTEPLPPQLWVVIEYKNPQYITRKRSEWIKNENRAAMNEDHFGATFWGRLGERLPSWAARLAIADNPDKPIITNQHIDIAEASLLAELNANGMQQDSGVLDSDIHKCVGYIVKLFSGDMTTNKSLNVGSNEKILADGACELHRIMGRLKYFGAYKKASMNIPNTDSIILNTIKTRGLIELSKEEAMVKYKYRGRVLKRV